MENPEVEIKGRNAVSVQITVLRGRNLVCIILVSYPKDITSYIVCGQTFEVILVLGIF